LLSKIDTYAPVAVTSQSCNMLSIPTTTFEDDAIFRLEVLFSDFGDVSVFDLSYFSNRGLGLPMMIPKV